MQLRSPDSEYAKNAFSVETRPRTLHAVCWGPYHLITAGLLQSDPLADEGKGKGSHGKGKD